MKVLIIGCGYLGQAVGMEFLKKGSSVCGVIRSSRRAKLLEANGFKIIVGDCTTTDGAALIGKEQADVVIFSISSQGRDYKETYVAGMRQILNALSSKPPQYFFYTSSTSVYAQTDGEFVNELSETNPPHENGQTLLDAERLLLSASLKKCHSFVLRLSGIYGPERHFILNRLKSDAESLPGEGNHWVNQIHRDDAVSAILHLTFLQNQKSQAQILNVSDDTPVIHSDFVKWICEKLNRPMPKYLGGPNSTKRGREDFQPNRRISNEALKNLGWAPKYPSFREGLPEIVASNRLGTKI